MGPRVQIIVVANVSVNVYMCSGIAQIEQALAMLDDAPKEGKDLMERGQCTAVLQLVIIVCCEFQI